MQMFGVGILELTVILLLSVLVIGPDRVPQFAADLAKWIRQARSYANHLMKDFNEVVGDLEKEVGASREDWKEIASVVNRHTGDVVREVQRAATQIEEAVPTESDLASPSTTAATSAITANGSSLQPIELPRPAPNTAVSDWKPVASPAASATTNGHDTAVPPPIEPASDAFEAELTAAANGEQPWYVPARSSRRRSLDE